MFELAIPASGSSDAKRFVLQDGQTYVLGRDPKLDIALDDPAVSQRHCVLFVRDGQVDLERLSEARNPVFHAGDEITATAVVRHGETVVVGRTPLRFTRLDDTAAATPGISEPVEEVTFDPQYLRSLHYRNANDRIAVLSHLPEVIWGATTDAELYDRLAALLLAGVAHADAVAMVTLDGGQVETLHWERRRQTSGDVRPSGRLVRAALQTQRKTILHVWGARPAAGDDYTAVAEFDWAYCTPVLERSGRAWGMYFAGRSEGLDGQGTLETLRPGPEGHELHADVKFTELVAEVVSAVRGLGDLERTQAGLRQFFAPAVLSALVDDPKLLEPRECEVTVMFCDLRGFSRRSEESAGDLLGLLERVSTALEVMNREIQAHGGVTADFLGDAALGFWGWPLSSDEAPLNACRAALAIRRAFAEAEQHESHPLRDFRTGIGIAHGRAVAGKIGPPDHVKVTVFGPVVNLASRLEGMTKQLHAPIVLDEGTADLVRERLDPAEGRTRRLPRVLPAGLTTPVSVSELLPSAEEFPELSDEHVRSFELAVEHFAAGRWDEAYVALHEVPASDRAQDFLTMRIAQANRVAPPDWDGIAALPQK